MTKNILFKLNYKLLLKVFLITSTLENKFVIENLIFLHITKLVIFASSCLKEPEAAFLGLKH